MAGSASPVCSLQVISSPGVGGREIYAPVLARKLASQGHPAWVLARPGTLVSRLAGEWGLPVIAREQRPYFDPGFILWLARFLKTHPVQVIHAHWSRDLSNLILAAAWSGRKLPLVLTKHVYATSPKRDPFHAWVFKHTDHVLGVSQLVTDNVVATVPVDPSKVTTCYNGLDLERVWNPDLVTGMDLRPDWGIPTGAPVLGYVGRLNAGKGVHLVLSAFAEVAEAFPDWHLALIGRAVGDAETAFAEQWRQWSSRQAWAERVHWLGFRDDMQAVMRTLDLLVCASAFESLGMVVVEAMAMERPVVGPDTGGVPEIITPGRGGELFHYPDTHDLAAKLRPLMADPDLRQRMGREGRQAVREKFDLDRAARDTVALYRGLIARKGR